MEIDCGKGGRSPRPSRRLYGSNVLVGNPEVELYLHLLVLLYLVDHEQWSTAEKVHFSLFFIYFKSLKLFFLFFK